jgi:magnesium transporter
VEEFPGTLFFNIKSLLPTEFSDNISVEQIVFDKGGVLISFQEKKNFFTHIRERIRIQSSIVRSKKADFCCTFFWMPLWKTSTSQ